MNIFIDLESDAGKPRAKIIPLDFFSGNIKQLDHHDIPNTIILSPEMIYGLHSKVYLTLFNSLIILLYNKILFVC